MKKIVIMRSNPVNPDSRVEKEAWSLVSNGYDVHIIAWDRASNHLPKEEKIIVSGISIPITRIGYKAEFGAGMRSIIPYLQFQLSLRKWLRTNRTKYDAVHACDFDTAFFTYKLVKHYNKLFIFDIFDMIASEPKNLRGEIIHNAQIDIINNSDATIICTEQRKKQIIKASPKRLEVIHNTPFDGLLIDSGKFLLDKNKIKVVYVGILQEDRMLLELLDYFSKHKNIEFHCGGFGRLEKQFIEYSAKCDNIFYYGKLRYSETLELESKCDIMLAIYDPSNANNRNAAPNKFYESLMLGKPVVMVNSTGMSQIVKDNDLGVLIDYSEESFEKGMNILIQRKEEWPEIANRARMIYLQDYNWSVMSDRLNNLYKELFSN